MTLYIIINILVFFMTLYIIINDLIYHHHEHCSLLHDPIHYHQHFSLLHDRIYHHQLCLMPDRNPIVRIRKSVIAQMLYLRQSNGEGRDSMHHYSFEDIAPQWLSCFVALDTINDWTCLVILNVRDRLVKLFTWCELLSIGLISLFLGWGRK